MPDASSTADVTPLDAALRLRVDAQYAAWYDKHLASIPIPVGAWDPAVRNPPAVSGAAPPLPCDRREITLDTFTIRIYTPAHAATPSPVLVWYHGGGMATGSLESDPGWCTRVATVARCTVVAVDYRLAPEHPFPAGHEDAWSALKYVVEHAAELGVDATRLGVGGMSSGGNLAACVALRAGAEGVKIRFAALGVPVCDNTTDEVKVSWKEMDNAPGLPSSKMLWYRRLYLPNEADWADPRCSPLLADDAALRAATDNYYITSCGLDPLRSEGEAYAARLSSLGKNVVHKLYPTLPHAVMGFDGVVDAAKGYVRDMAIYITEQFGGHKADCEFEALYPLGPEVGVPRLDRSADAPWVTMPKPMALGEAPVYRREDNTLHFVDFEAVPPTLNVIQLDEGGDAVGPPKITELADSVSVACFRENAPGYICAVTRGVAFMSPDGKLEMLKEIIPEDQAAALRMNDGAIDVAGRFWMTEIDIQALGLGTGRVPAGQVCLGRLWRYDPDGSLHLMDTDFSCGNGVCWSPDNTIMYVNDSRGITYAYDFDAATSAINNKRVLIDRRELGGEPDGMVVDVNGDLWIAVWGTHCLMHYAPDGRHLDDVRFGAMDLACPAFGGPDGDSLYIASATDLRPTRSESDMGGHLFKFQPGVKGLPKYRFKG